jgi:hypothetical protein
MPTPISNRRATRIDLYFRSIAASVGGKVG